ncbi:DUF3014 domain-containing protein [Alteromonas facilis]|uniref:DUF3014 domain-containing protein n=1 Tax=Alteromonas facilis TaxID=2048004 RepID=UPI000C292E09|nr:DUF3014 domain-containing protein [Alteromonas facilis]
MTTEESQAKSLKPHIIIAGGLLAVIAVVLLWPASESEVSQQPVAITPPPVVEQPQQEPEPMVDDTPLTTPDIQEVVIEPSESPEPLPTQEIEPDIIIDTSDAAITSALLEIADTPVIGHFIVDDSLLQRFVVTVNNLANEDIARNHQLLEPPEQAFKVYRQADREWIDAASYKRYTPYVDALETLDNEKLVSLYKRYEDDIKETFAEIAEPGESFEEVFAEAIDVLLDTPEIPTPVEVYRDSVMYKYKDERIESLSLPQKQLLRLGPDNMRRVKAKLRDLKSQLENGS